MINNPVVGMRVKGRKDARDEVVRRRANTLGTITIVQVVVHFDFQVQWEEDDGGVTLWWCKAADLDPARPLTPEEEDQNRMEIERIKQVEAERIAKAEDQQRRIAHANKYL